jgi:hypothetical protein
LLSHAAREERQVITQDIDSDGCHTEKQGHPYAPVAMGPRPIRPLDWRDNLAIATFVAVMTMYDLTHFESSFAVRPVIRGYVVELRVADGVIENTWI